ncbi:hypothetical protein ATANTOWER_018144 [Ataeniobius toweri]|uniref:Uncharacterized protein n=1 Tax=Ataeniobius toweri TaxID=208326 RepID=A0ABU7A3L8_9TELE|nr:hypothetical protein [Ataeniobius toweri]
MKIEIQENRVCAILTVENKGQAIHRGDAPAMKESRSKRLIELQCCLWICQLDGCWIHVHETANITISFSEFAWRSLFWHTLVSLPTRSVACSATLCATFLSKSILLWLL